MTSSPLFRPSPEQWQPHEYQKKAIKWLLQHACAALLLDPGLGKTSIALAAIKLLKKEGLLNRALVIAPLRVCYNVWPAEAEKWTDFTGLRVALLHGKFKEANLRSNADVYVINPEGLPWLMQSAQNGDKTDVKWFKSLHFDTLVVDELSKFKHHSTLRFKLLKPVLHTFQRRWGLTGSPAANGLMDLFGQAFVLDMGNAFGKWFSHFRMKYFYAVDHMGWEWKLQPGAEQLIYERLAPLALRMSAEDYLALPKLLEQTINVQLPDNARKIYNQMEDDLLALIEKELVTAPTSGVAAMKCRQLANGGVYMEPATPGSAPKVKEVHSAKADALVDLIGELQGQPLLVAYEFKHDRERILKAIGKGTPFIDGDVPPKKADVIIAAWNRGEIPVLLGQPAAIGHGLNLQGASNHVCWFSMIWDYEIYDQFIRRIYRQGQKADKVFVYHIVAEDTVDNAVLWGLRHKRKGQQDLFDGIKMLSRRRRAKA